MSNECPINPKQSKVPASDLNNFIKTNFWQEIKPWQAFQVFGVPLPGIMEPLSRAYLR
jgi:hypothetical protein